ncbi:ATP-dependent RNA helicase DBP5 [Drechslerella stenobrocha 248]|uniref:RNA helicase n=1 Tax=Drechslerella stenobrocha 248 TaxID=1043628 RepID=W7HTB1_9PEZI|nr:ATP-dependent RNA helicase DBP5 [Drechslerella stenobrocha 248]
MAEPSSKTSWADDVEEEAAAAESMAKPADTVEEPTADDDATGLVQNEHDVNVTLADMQGDADNPLYSIKSFQELGLNEDLQKGLILMRYSRPSKIQERALPLLLNDPPTNLIGQSQSGTGKTAAFVLAMLSRVDLSLNAPQALCLAPSRELARQILAVVDNMGSFMKIKTQFAVPLAVERGKTIDAHIVVGTPGTVLDCIKRRVLVAKDIRMICLDEADNMLDQQGLGDQCFRVKAMVPKNVQVLLFSATFPPKVVEYADKFAPNANKLTLKQEELTVDGIKQLYMDCEGEEEKYQIILKLYELMVIGQSIIFVRQRRNADELRGRMVADGHAVSSLHGAFEGTERDKVIDDFRFGRTKVLITTNVIARGIDVASVSLVVNYDLPTLADGYTPDFETYLHRIGRTGRFGRVGASVSFVHDKNSWEQMDAIQRHFNCRMSRIDTSDWIQAAKQIRKILKSDKSAASSSEQFMGVGSGN